MLDSQGVRLRLLRAVKDARTGRDEPADALAVLLQRIEALAYDLDAGMCDADGGASVT